VTGTITISAGFNGPPESGQGGYSAGLLANVLGGSDVEVTLRKPPPIDTPMTVSLNGAGAQMHNGDTLIAEATRFAVEIDLPDPVPSSEARQAAEKFPGFEGHIFPTCLVCGPDRAEGDGMRLFAGPVAGRDGISAAPWMAGQRFAGDDGSLRPEFIWAALDCPSGWAANDFAPGRHAVLGRIAARIVRPAPVGKHYVVIGWPRSEDGRKIHAGSAVFDEDGAAYAYALTTWIRLLE
jgi:hypothetical protein